MERIGNGCSRLTGSLVKVDSLLLCTSSTSLRVAYPGKWNYFRFECASLAVGSERLSILELRQKGLGLVRATSSRRVQISV